MDVELEAELSGIEGRDDPLRIRATGPYRSGNGGFPSLDLDLAADASGAQPISLGLVSVEDRVFVKFAGLAYELPAEESSNPGDNPCGRRGLRIDPRPWVENAEAHGDETVGGVETTHASGELDSDRMLRDLNDFIERCGAVLGPASSVEPLSRAQLDRAASELKDPTFDVYVGKEDDLIRRLSATIEANALTLKFSIEFSDLNGDQAIELPRRSRPLSELTSQLGLGALGDTLGLDPENPQDPQGQSYSECLDALDPADTEGLERCSDLLNAP